MAAGHYQSWAMDGDFFGGGGWYTTVIPVDCQSDRHDHLPGDSNYACQRALAQLIAAVRQSYPEDLHLHVPAADGPGRLVAAQRGCLFHAAGIGHGQDNLTAGDQIRTWSRVRRPSRLLPPLPRPAAAVSEPGRRRQAAAQLAQRASRLHPAQRAFRSPNQLYYLPTKTGIPAADKAEIRKWLDWGRKNVAYLKVRKDLPDWPAAGKVDGSAHIVGDRGLVFLFNPSSKPLPGEFALTRESIGLLCEGQFRIAQEYPPLGRTQTASSGETIRWEVAPRTATVLRISPRRCFNPSLDQARRKAAPIRPCAAGGPDGPWTSWRSRGGTEVNENGLPGRCDHSNWPDSSSSIRYCDPRWQESARFRQFGLRVPLGVRVALR